jgi:Tol biopolymer transport system component
MPGRSLNHYEILKPLGTGGMGEVFQARDTRLNRLVAVKVLRPEYLGQVSRKSRFIQEAQAASALNHSNVVTIHDIGQADGVDYIVMEFLAGRTLDERIPRRGARVGMPLKEALGVAVQVAEGLRCAHAAGIVHRDLKPSNIMVGDEGQVKILDFGLAKLTERASSGDDPDETRTERPETEEGMVMGTTAYMSPEQAEGRKVDARTDIFSFGVVLYEMLSGRKPFDGPTRVAITSAILKEEPRPIDNIPADLDKILRRCLRKDRDKRIQHMDDVKLALEEVREDSESGKLDAAVAPPAPRRRWPWIAAAAGLAVAAAGGYFVARRAPTAAPSTTGPVLRQLTFDSGLTTEPTVWPAGNMVAYASDRGGNNLDIWVQRIDTKEARRLTTHEANDREPSFSHDGSRIAFRSERDGGGIYVMSALGGGERRVADGGRSPRFSPDGRWVAYYTGSKSFSAPFASNPSALYVAPVAGGAPRRLVPDFIAVSEAAWSPDGKMLLFLGGPNFGMIDWYVVPVEGGPPRKTEAVPHLRKHEIQPQAPASWSADGVLFSAHLGDARNIWSIRLDPNTLQPIGEVRRLTSGNNLEDAASLAGGRLVYSSLLENVDVWSLPIDTNTARVTGDAQRITEDVAPNYSPSVSLDGRHVVYATSMDRTSQVVHADLSTRQVTVVATSGDTTGAPRISRDGALVAFNDREEGKEGQARRVVRVAPVSGGPSRTLSCEECQVRNWADDRRVIVSRKGTGLIDATTGQTNLFLPLDGGRGHSAPRMSPDGRWILFYFPIENDRTRMFSAAVRDTNVPKSEWIQLSEGRSWDIIPELSPDGKTLYFLSHRDGYRCHWAMKFDSGTGRSIGEPFAVQHYHNPQRSPGYVRPGRGSNSVARDKIVFTMAERTGNIWMAELP